MDDLVTCSPVSTQLELVVCILLEEAIANSRGQFTGFTLNINIYDEISDIKGARVNNLDVDMRTPGIQNSVELIPPSDIKLKNILR